MGREWETLALQALTLYTLLHPLTKPTSYCCGYIHPRTPRSYCYQTHEHPPHLFGHRLRGRHGRLQQHPRVSSANMRANTHTHTHAHAHTRTQNQRAPRLPAAAPSTAPTRSQRSSVGLSGCKTGLFCRALLLSVGLCCGTCNATAPASCAELGWPAACMAACRAAACFCSASS